MLSWKLTHGAPSSPLPKRQDLKVVTRGLLRTSLLAVCVSISASAADSISGVVRNQTRNQPASGDDVILLRLDQGMEEEARTRTDEMGAFTIKVQSPDKLHLIRVMHQGVNYDERAAVGEPLKIAVFDAAPKVSGVTGGIEIIRTGNKGNLLHVSDMIEIKNDSSPPLTQAGERTFEVYLPRESKIDSVMAAGPGKIGALITASPVPGDPGHSTVNFPLRPGSTKFAFNYDIPYTGHAAFRTRFAYPVQQLAVMLPPTMRFASRSSAFHLLETGSKEYQVEATTPLQAGNGPSFEISGNGPLPQLQARAQAPTSSPALAPAPGPTAAAPADSAPPLPAIAAARSTTPAQRPMPSINEWWLLGTATVLVMGICGLLVWLNSRRSKTKPKTTTTPADTEQGQAPSASLLDALKEQLLEVETARLDGSISREEYDAAKRALEGTVKRALARSTAIQ